jgi:hypothetical protein
VTGSDHQLAQALDVVQQSRTAGFRQHLAQQLAEELDIATERSRHLLAGGLAGAGTHGD